MAKKIDAIYDALVGDEKLGHRGIVKRVECLEVHKRKTAAWTAGIIGGGSVVIWLLSHVIPVALQMLR